MTSFVSNPFATRYISPGHIEWIGSGDYFEQLVSRWKALNGRASIVGVHGSGKSTLLEHLQPYIGNVVWRQDALGQVVFDGRSADSCGINERPATVWLQLRKTNSQSMKIPWEKLSQGFLLILDGYEQLNRWRRVVVLARTKMRGVQLLVTSHRRTLLPPLCELSISVSTARQIIARLASEHEGFATINDDEIRVALESHHGNMREVLMDFYDQFECRSELANPKVESNS